MNDAFDADGIREWDGVSEPPQGSVPVRAFFEKLDTLRLFIEPVGDVELELASQSYIVFRNVFHGEEPTEYQKTVMKLLDTESVNLWFQQDEGGTGMHLVDSLEKVRYLEEMLKHHENQPPPTTH